MASLRLTRVPALLAIALALVAGAAVPDAGAAPPPITWLKGEGNFTKAHRSPQSISKIVVHVTEGSFWGSVRWLKNPRAHASSHYVVSRAGEIVQLVHVSDIAWHAGNWGTNVRSVGIEHEGFTYGPNGFTDKQYRQSAKLTAWLAKRALMPIDRAHIIGHHEVPGPNGGRGGASGHTDPGPRWNWARYLRLVRSYVGRQKLSVAPLVPQGPLRGIVPWRAKATGGIQHVQFSIDGRVVWVDRKPPFAFAGGRGLNTTTLANGRHVLEVHGVAGPGRYDIARTRVVVANKTFSLTTAGARPWQRVRGALRVRTRVWGAKADRVVFRLDGRPRVVDRRPPFVFRWQSRRGREGRHVLEVVAYSVDGRVTSRRIPIVVSNKPKATKPKPKPKPPTPPPPQLRVVSLGLTPGQTVTGLVVWRVEAIAAARVEFLVDGVVRGADVAAPYTLGWNASAEPPGQHRLTARALGKDGSAVEKTVTVTVPPPETSGSGAP
jgi:hypothetical protein